MKSLGKIFYRYRGYTPLPFILIMFLFFDSKPTSIIMGLIFITVGEAIRIWAVSYSGSETRATRKFVGTKLVTQGPYSYSRNPMYLGNIFIYSGFGIMTFSLFPYLQIIALIYFVFQYYCIVLNEEEYLNKRFNGFYDKYKRIVKRFFPQINTIPEEIHSKLSFNLSSGLRSEKRSIQAMVVTLMVIFLLYFSDFKLPDLF